jgi:hypothetical protein
VECDNRMSGLQNGEWKTECMVGGLFLYGARLAIMTLEVRGVGSL